MAVCCWFPGVRIATFRRAAPRVAASPDGVLLPAHFVHDLGQSDSVLPLEHGHYLGRLATLARRAGFLRLGGPFARERVLGGGGLSWSP